MKTYPIAEIFSSIQGEGCFTGTPMLFVRLAGCNVGKYQTKDEVLTFLPGNAPNNEMVVLAGKHSICTTFDGQRFLCDTDYHANEHLTVEQVLSHLTSEEHVCITGGEPFLHNLEELIDGVNQRDCLVHIETSGTKPIIAAAGTWITCCPKEGSMTHDIFQQVDEWKILVGPGFREEEFKQLYSEIPASVKECAVFFQPINGVNEIWKENLARCLDLLKRYPSCKLSAQLHKYLEVR